MAGCLSLEALIVSYVACTLLRRAEGSECYLILSRKFSAPLSLYLSLFPPSSLKTWPFHRFCCHFMARSRLQELKRKSEHVYNDPHNPFVYLDRAYVYAVLGFPDLAAADAYRALTLLDSVIDPDECEFQARRIIPSTTCEAANSIDAVQEDARVAKFLPITKDEYHYTVGSVYVLLARCLVRCGCLRDAYDFAERAVSVIDDLGSACHDGNKNIQYLKGLIEEIKCNFRFSNAKGKGNSDDFDASLLPSQGYARRVLYPWNEHEPDRKASETLELLNQRLQHVAPKCQVRAVALPALHGTATSTTTTHGDEVSVQLGLFAKEDIAPDEILLRETSLLTATNRLHDVICDACNAPLPGLSGPETPVPCSNCEDTFFCTQACHDVAQETYHAAVCGQEGLESIGKDITDARDKADYLYLLLLGRALAMSATQNVHPLDLPEIKYIWGDFHDYDPTGTTTTANGGLPFSFHLNILQPMRLLEEMGLDPFATLPKYDTWIINTLYAKFRGTASGRLSTWDGGPEVCAVHPLWCLANHSCDPNVRWEWGSEITFSVRGKSDRAIWGSRKQEGDDDYIIRKDQEILNHYCDIGLDVKERREWARGALGGICRCERCKWESGSI